MYKLILQEKAPYVAKAEKRKVEYNKNIQAYNKRLVSACFTVIVVSIL